MYQYNAYMMTTTYKVVWLGQSNDLESLIGHVKSFNPHYGYVQKRDGAHNVCVWDTVIGHKASKLHLYS